MSADIHENVVLILTRPALERLIGGDSEMEIQLRHAAVREVMNRHAAAILKADGFDEIESRLRLAVQAQVDQSIGTKQVGWSRMIVLSPAVQRAIHVLDEAAVSKIARDSINKVVGSLNLSEMIEARVKSQIKDEINAGVKARLAELSKGLA